ncbi:hypothetical protein GCM10010961_24890 [Pseudodonghicola xiamenensis]|uniref:Uncharacterized protein n=1 Tax=Pseudodonghicola xiamenensis TaxID=337702 RepID=A0A8J3H997_9RHOB|nr:hypothetical protein GCM10010961_24890 [Pseudodonghicola xiamenensis]
MNGERHDLLRNGGTQTDGKAGNRKPYETGRDGSTDERNRQCADRHENEGFAFKPVSEWRQKENTDSIADLCQDRHGNGKTGAQAEISGQMAEKGLIVIAVGDGCPCPHGQEENQSRREAFGLYDVRGLRVHVRQKYIPVWSAQCSFAAP